MADRTFAKFTFFKLDPAWQRRDAEARAEDKREFLAACEDFATDRSLRAYSTVGTRGDTDLLLLAQSPVLEDIHTFHVVLAQSGLAKWATIPHSYLAMTKRSPYSESEARPEICTSERRYLIIYPMDKKREWYRLPARRARRIMAEHIAIGRRYPEITINTAYSFGLDDQEFVVSFECDEPGEFLDLVQELRGLGVERLHPARHPDLHLRRDVGRARRWTRSTAPRRSRRSRRSPEPQRSIPYPSALPCATRHPGQPAPRRDRRLRPGRLLRGRDLLQPTRSPSRSTCSTACRPRSAWSAPGSPPTTRRSSP